MKVVTAEEMRKIDSAAIGEYGIPVPVLMERAGLAVASRVRELFVDDKEKGIEKVLVLCGGGNNGGDGLVVARNLFNQGIGVHVLMFAGKNSLGPDCAAQYRTARKTGVPVEFRASLRAEDVRNAVVVDAVFGTGLSRPVGKEIAGAFALLNDSRAPVVSVDIPSGISSDTGEVLGEAIRAACTVTFGLPKRGHCLYPGAEYSGRLFVEDIGFPAALLASDALKVSLAGRELVSGLFAPRQKNSYKGDFGHVLVLAGARGKTGAAMMTARACMRSGAGLVTIGVPESLLGIYEGRVTEEMVLPLPDDGKGMLSAKAVDEVLEFVSKRADIIAAGPGIGVSPDTGQLMTELVGRSPVPMVIDADGLNSISAAMGDEKGIKGLLRQAKSPLVLTPHPGEMARLLRRKPAITTKDIEGDRINTATGFAKAAGVYLVLKGVPAVSASPSGDAFLNTSGNPGMATAGAGDVLTGIIAALLGQDLDPLDASVFGVFLHGLSGDCAAERKGEQSLIASDLIDFLPDAFQRLLPR